MSFKLLHTVVPYNDNCLDSKKNSNFREFLTMVISGPQVRNPKFQGLGPWHGTLWFPRCKPSIPTFLSAVYACVIISRCIVILCGWCGIYGTGCRTWAAFVRPWRRVILPPGPGTRWDQFWFHLTGMAQSFIPVVLRGRRGFYGTGWLVLLPAMQAW